MKLERINRQPKSERGRIVWVLAALGSPVSEVAAACRVRCERLRAAMAGAALEPAEEMRLGAWLGLVLIRVRAREGQAPGAEDWAEATSWAVVAGLTDPPPPLDAERGRGA